MLMLSSTELDIKKIPLLGIYSYDVAPDERNTHATH